MKRVRVTASIDPEILDRFKRLAVVRGVSLSSCIGDWLADTIEGSEYVASTIEKAKGSPVRVLREMNASFAVLQEGSSLVHESLTGAAVGRQTHGPAQPGRGAVGKRRREG